MPDTDPPLTRRRFTHHLALGTMAASVVGCSGTQDQQNTSSQDEPSAEPPQTAEQPADAPPEELPQEAKPEQLSADELIIRLVEQVETRNLTPEQREAILQEVRRQLRRSRILSVFPLKNDDAPAFVFRPFRGDERS